MPLDKVLMSEGTSNLHCGIVNNDTHTLSASTPPVKAEVPCLHWIARIRQ